MSRRLGSDVWIQFTRIFRKTCQKRGFRSTQIRHWLVEIVISRRGQTDIQISKIDPVEISGENLIFRPELLETKSCCAFDQLRPKCARVPFRNLDQLLGDRGCAGCDAPMAERGERSPNRGEPIDSVMPEKAFVLGGEDRVDHVSRHLFQGQLPAETFRHARFAQWNSISIEQCNALHRRAQQR